MEDEPLPTAPDGKLAAELTQVEASAGLLRRRLKEANRLPETFPEAELDFLAATLEHASLMSGEGVLHALIYARDKAAAFRRDEIVIADDLPDEDASDVERGGMIDLALAGMLADIGVALSAYRSELVDAADGPSVDRRPNAPADAEYDALAAEAESVAAQAGEQAERLEPNPDAEPLARGMRDIQTLERQTSLEVRTTRHPGRLERLGTGRKAVAVGTAVALRAVQFACEAGKIVVEELSNAATERVTAIIDAVNRGAGRMADKIEEDLKVRGPARPADPWAAIWGGPEPGWVSGRGEDQYGRWSEFVFDGVTQRLRWCPPGRFLMGSPEDEAERFDREGPQTGITFERGFWLFESPVTQALYKAVTGHTPSGFEGPDRPVEKVSWDDANTFLDRINGRIPDLDLCLPSEAQWEYACRAGSTTPFEPNVARIHAGASITPDEVNYDGNFRYGPAAEGEYRAETLPVKPRGFRPNAWGLWQMHGNVFEWCADAWQDSHEGAVPYGSPRPVSQQDGGSNRVIRGGSWRNLARNCRSASRYRGAPVDRYDNLGFRPARGQASGAQAGAAEPPAFDPEGAR